jgi:hypothetical protein
MLIIKKNNKFFVNLEVINYEKMAMFWFFFKKIIFKIYFKKKSYKISVKKFFLYFFSYNIFILVLFHENSAIKYNNNKIFYKIKKSLLFSVFRLFLINFWNIEFIIIILNIFIKNKKKKENFKNQNLSHSIKLFIKFTPLNQIKIFQLFFNFLFKLQNFIDIFILFKDFFKNLINHLCKIYSYDQYIKYFFSYIFNLFKTTNKEKNFCLYSLIFLKNIKNLLLKKNKNFIQFKRITNIMILYPNLKFLNNKYTIITRYALY